jgi:hypothetical protein
MGSEILDLEQGADLSPGAVGNDQSARPRQRLQTGGEMWRLADHAALLRSTRADQIANDDETAGDADPHVQRLLCGEPPTASMTANPARAARSASSSCASG